MEIRKASLQRVFDRARAASPILFDRVMKNAAVGSIDACWPWALAPDKDGYGILKVGGKKVRAHRAAHDLFHPPAESMVVRHICNNPACVNPAHLRAGTPAENAVDRLLAGRGGNLKGEANGRSKLSESDVRAIRASSLSGSRIAEEFGISKVMACRIRRGGAWSHI